MAEGILRKRLSSKAGSQAEVVSAGVAAAAVVAVVLWTGNQSLDEITPPSSATDFEILLTEDSLEMLEDLEFYSWIELEEGADETLETEDIVG